MQAGTAVLDWYRPGKVLRLTVHGEYTAQAADEMDARITAELERAERPLYLLIDANDMAAPHNFRQIREAQRCMNHPRLSHILVLAEQRVVKLALMVIFNAGRANLKLLAGQEELDRIMRWHD
jgi:hypothetical protein